MSSVMASFQGLRWSGPYLPPNFISSRILPCCTGCVWVSWTKPTSHLPQGLGGSSGCKVDLLMTVLSCPFSLSINVISTDRLSLTNLLPWPIILPLLMSLFILFTVFTIYNCPMYMLIFGLFSPTTKSKLLQGRNHVCFVTSLYLQYLGQCPEHGRYPVNICEMNEEKKLV